MVFFLTKKNFYLFLFLIYIKMENYKQMKVSTENFDFS